MTKTNSTKKISLAALKAKLQGKVAPTKELKVLADAELSAVAGGLPRGRTDSCCPCADDCED